MSSTKPGYRDRFQAEAMAVAKLNHPSIVHVYAMGQIEDVHYIAMEYVEGINLREFVVKQGALDLPQALSIMKQTAQAIGAAGEAGIDPPGREAREHPDDPPRPGEGRGFRPVPPDG